MRARIIKTIIISVLMLHSMTTASQAKEWRGIVPLHSNRKDVERLIGSPAEPGGNVYNLENEVVLIDYSDSPCERGWPFGWDVPPGTVTSITVNPRKTIMLSDLGFDLSKYQKMQDPEVGAVVYYYNSEEGVHIQSLTYEPVAISINYLPTAKDKQILCPDAYARLSKEVEGRTDPNPLLIYHGASVVEVRAQLNSIGKLLQSKADSRAFILVYAGRRAYDGEAKAHAMQVKNYLIKSFGIKPERVVGVDGGFREEFTAEIYIISGEMPEPLTSPTIRPSKVQIVKRNK
jgi:hypothetical protein